jgi:hypothetical protein
MKGAADQLAFFFVEDANQRDHTLDGYKLHQTCL